MITNKSQLDQTFQKLAASQIIEKSKLRNLTGGSGEPPPLPDDPNPPIGSGNGK